MGKRHYLYIEMAGCFAYLALVTDAYSHKIVGWELAPSLRACNALAALKMALNSLPEGYSGLIHHSDRGSQYCSASYVNLLTQHKVQISMTESGDPLENAIAERINGILKTEWIYDVKLNHGRKLLTSLVELLIYIIIKDRIRVLVIWFLPWFIKQILKRNANGRIIIERGMYLMKKSLSLSRSVKAQQD
ncbi:transposase [Bacteroides fragilis]